MQLCYQSDYAVLYILGVLMSSSMFTEKPYTVLSTETGES